MCAVSTIVRGWIPIGAPYIFIAKLISGQMNGPERSSPDLLPDHILVDAVFGRAVVLARGIFGAGVQRFLMSHDQLRACHERALRKLTFTGRLVRGFRRRCLCGLSNDAAELDIVRLVRLDLPIRIAGKLTRL